MRMGVETEVVDRDIYERVVDRFRERSIRLPTFAQLTEPATLPAEIRSSMAGLDFDAAEARNLFRVHWYNRRSSSAFVDVPEHLELPSTLTGVPAKIILLLGDQFPLIRAHKVLAAYGCLVPRLVTGQFDPVHHRAVWPSTGNYCRGGVAISRILDCRGVAVLPEGMSRERFDWLERWTASPDDIIRTPGTESNVKEIYDRCAELDLDPVNVIFNQFSELGNYLVHYQCTGRAVERVYDSLVRDRPDLRLRGFLSATGSAGTLAAGDYLKQQTGARIVAVEALECPTLLYNGFGEHNIQGIGDKHVPLIHNVMNTDCVAAVSDRSTDQLFVAFNCDAGRRYLAGRLGVPEESVERLRHLGISGICNLLAAIKTAKYFGLGENDVLITVATDGAELYETEKEKILARDFGGEFDEIDAARVVGQHLLGTATDHYLELSHRDRKRIFNLGYFTWVEQQGVSLGEFTAREHQDFWRDLQGLPAIWDERIEELNRRVESGG